MVITGTETEGSTAHYRGREIVKKASFFIAVFAVFSSGCWKEEGAMALPDINPRPEQSQVFEASVVRAPPSVNLSAFHEYMFARYESRELACSQIRQLAGGSVVTPVYELPVQRDGRGGFVVWKDLVNPDRCNWKLTMLRYGLVDANGRTAVDTGFAFPEVGKRASDRYCIWKGDLNGECRMYRLTSKDGQIIDDTTISIRVKED